MPDFIVNVILLFYGALFCIFIGEGILTILTDISKHWRNKDGK